jgi:hypothetical protein
MVATDAGWFSATWENADFWRQIVATMVGVLAGGLAAWLVERGVSASDQRRRDAMVLQTIVCGLRQNRVALERMLEVAKGQRTIPSLRLYETHYSSTALHAADAFASTPRRYEAFLIIADAVAHLNRRLDQAMPIALGARDNRASAELDPYIREWIELATPVANWIQALLIELDPSAGVTQGPKEVPPPSAELDALGPAPEPVVSSTEDSAYRQHLVEAREKAQADYDKTIVLLAGGALGLSLTFVSDIVGNDVPLATSSLSWGWSLLVASLLTILASFCISRLALLGAIQRFDRGDRRAHAGTWSRLTEFFNLLAGAILIAGLSLVVYFAVANYGQSS